MTDAVRGRYLPAATYECPTFVDDSSWDPLVDGATYLTELAACLRSASRGDTVLVAGLELDPTIDLLGNSHDDPDYEPLGELLAGLARDGVDVRVLLASRVIAASVPGPWLGGFHDGARNAATLRAWRPSGVADAAPLPLTGRVLLDYSGALLGSNHQKFVVVHAGGELTAFVGGIDLSSDRFDAVPHDRLTLNGERWGWHDVAVRVRGRAAERVWDVFTQRWTEASTLPRKWYLHSAFDARQLNPDRPVAPPGLAPRSREVARPGTSVRVLRSVAKRKIHSALPWRRTRWETLPDRGIHEVFTTLTAALAGAERYIYIEDQYLEEALGGDPAYELYPALLDAARRGVKVILVGSGTRDPGDAGVHLRPINRTVTRDVQRKVLDQLDLEHRGNVVFYRVEQVTVHAKVVLVDDRFACIGSANMFSRSMVGTDCELSVAIATTTNAVADLRTTLWADHLRAPLTPQLREALADLDLALGIWQTEWSAAATSTTWLKTGSPPGFDPAERVLQLVEPA